MGGIPTVIEEPPPVVPYALVQSGKLLDKKTPNKRAPDGVEDNVANGGAY